MSERVIVKVRVADSSLGRVHSAVMYDETRKFHRLIEFNKIKKHMGGSKVRFFLIDVFARKFKILKLLEDQDW